MFENVAIRILVGIVIIVFGFMVLKYINADKTNPVTEYRAPASRKKKVLSKLEWPRGILKRTGAPKNTKYISFAPSAVDTTMKEYGAWDTNRNSSSGIMNQMKNTDTLVSNNMMSMAPPPVSNSVNQLPSIPMIDSYAGDDDMFSSYL